MDRARFEEMLRRRATRRGLLVGGTGLAVAASLPGRPTRVLGQGTPAASPVTGGGFGTNPFTLGVASGDPLPTSVVLWTRLAPVPTGGGGMDPIPYEVRWELAADDGFARVVQSGAATASPALAHSVHVDATGLEPAREYFYRFMAGSEVSPVGRTRTAPAPGATVDRLRFAFASCQHYEQGYYTSYPHLVADDLDLVVFLGDYIYEGGISDPETTPRQHNAREIETLDDYRNRLALYKTDPDLQAAHAAYPWLLTWDDHEVDNDYAGAYSQDDDPAGEFLARRAASYQAYYEHMPLRPASLPTGADMLLYRRLGWGSLAEFQVLDTRQYRTDHPCGNGEQAPCPAAVDPAATLTGPAQERWLLEGLDASTATWNVLAQQVLMAELEHSPTPDEVFWTDAWDGYPAARNRILGHIMSRDIRNPVVITGDWHSTFVNDLKADFGDPSSPTVASEFVVTSISSNGDGGGYEEYYGPMVPDNPHIRFFDGDRRGYQRVEVTEDNWRVDLRMVETVLSPAAGVSTVASFVVENGVPGPQAV